MWNIANLYFQIKPNYVLHSNQLRLLHELFFYIFFLSANIFLHSALSSKLFNDKITEYNKQKLTGEKK